MTAADLAAWRTSRAGTREALPDPAPDEEQEALTVIVDHATIGRVLIGCVDAAGTRRCSVRALETDLTSDDTEEWAEVLTAIGEHARDTGAGSVQTSVQPRLVGLFEAAGFRATVTSHAKRLDANPRFQEDRRVDVRPMDEEERHRFAQDARSLLGAGTTHSGLLDPEESPELLAASLARLSLDPLPTEELLMTGTVDGSPVGRVWGTLVEDDGSVDYVGRIIELFPEHRGQRLTPSFLGAMARHLRELGVRDLYLRVHDLDRRARDSFTDVGIGINDVHLRKDLD